MTVFVLIILCIGYGALFYVIYSIYSLLKGKFGVFAPYVPSVGKAKGIMLDLARQELTAAKNQLTVVDLGSGTGTLLLPLAKEFPQHKFIGIEYDWMPLSVAFIRGRKLKNIEWHKQNFMDYPLDNADIVFCYLLKTMQERVGLKLDREIKNSCTVITELYPVNHLQTVQSFKPKLNLGVPVYKMKKSVK